jgi:ABC-2 type transport system permease protein
VIDRVLIKKYVNQSSLLFASCAIVLFVFSWVRVWVGTFFNLTEYGVILDQLAEFEKYSPIEFSALLTYTGQVGLVYEEPIVIACIVIWAVARGSDVVSGELGRGTLEMLLSQPVSRERLLCSHAVVSISGLGLLCLLVWGGIALGIQTNVVDEEVPAPSVEVPLLNWQIPLPGGEPIVEQVPLKDRVDAGHFGAATFHLFAFGFFILALATLISSIDRYRWRTVGMVVGIYVVQLVMYALGLVSESLSWLLGGTFLSCYKPQNVTALIEQGTAYAPWSLTDTPGEFFFPPLAYPLILLSIGFTFYVVAIIIFRRRDLPAPL